MLKFRTTDPRIPPDDYSLKEFRCSECGMSHAYHWDSPLYCENQKCGVLLPEINAVVTMLGTRLSWHFGRY